MNRIHNQNHHNNFKFSSADSISTGNNEEESLNLLNSGLGATSRKFVSSCDLASEEASAKIRHKKSSSFSSPQFPEVNAPQDSASWKKQHRKTKSDSQKKVYTTRKSQSLTSNEVTYIATSNPTTIKTSTQLNSLYAEMYSADRTLEPFAVKTPERNEVASTRVVIKKQSSIGLPQILSILLLFILIVTGFAFTPK